MLLYYYFLYVVSLHDFVGNIVMLFLLLLVGCLSAACGVFFHIQAFLTGFGRKRWTVAGLIFGPLIWPMFAMKKRMQLNQLFGLNQLIFRA